MAQLLPEIEPHIVDPQVVLSALCFSGPLGQYGRIMVEGWLRVNGFQMTGCRGFAGPCH
jgi:hypothetical protein